MIFCNLRVLMAERNVNIREVSEETGLSRTTISNLMNNQVGGIQYKTLIKLCEFLDCDVDDIIKFLKE